jgi:hypothetical protein
MSFGFPFFHDFFFGQAKEKIKHEQLLFGRKNDLRLRQIVTEFQEKKSARLNKMIEQTFYNSVISQLDDYYFRRNQIPLVLDIDSALPEIGSDQLAKIIKKYNFITISLAGIKRPELSVILYPADQDWKPRLAKITKLIAVLTEQDKKPAKKSETAVTSEDSSGFNVTQRDRAKRITEYLQKKSEYQVSRKMPEPEADPYKALAQEMDKFK